MSTLISFVCFLCVFLFIGLASSRVSKGTRSDYYLASHSVPPWLVGLSAVATNNSGYMFIGVIGYTYSTGLPAIWIMLGWITGDFLASLFIHKKLRLATEASGEASYAGVIAQWQKSPQYGLQRLIGAIAFLFLLAYASAQLVAGGKALFAVLEWPLWSGAVVGAILITLYCVAGGIRASIWTDAAQSIVMISAMGLLMVIAVAEQGGVNNVINQLSAIPSYMTLVPKDLVMPGIFGAVLFAVSWLFAGLSVIGQPHIMVRFMTLDQPQSFFRVRVWYYSWFTAFYAMATMVGLLSRLYFSESNFDPELALPYMAQELLPGVLVGLILAGIFAATISTADSLVLSCSAAITHDLVPQRRIENRYLIKGATVLTTVLALGWALLNKQSVFSLVIMSWSALASAFAPLLIVLVMGFKPSQKIAIASVVLGLAVSLIWRYLDWHVYMYEGMPAIMLVTLLTLLAVKLTPKFQ